MVAAVAENREMSGKKIVEEFDFFIVEFIFFHFL